MPTIVAVQQEISQLMISWLTDEMHAPVGVLKIKSTKTTTPPMSVSS